MAKPERQETDSRREPAGETTGGTRGTPSGSFLKILPVDSHRFFACWRLTPELKREAERSIPHPAAAGGHLLRVFRLDRESDDLEEALATENFPVAEPQGEGYFSLNRPGGYVLAVLGAQDRSGRFFPLLRSPRAALPEAPASRSWREGTKSAAVSEKDVLQRAALTDLPSELCRIPGDTAPPSPRRDSAEGRLASPEEAAVPLTPALDERKVVIASLDAVRREPVAPQVPAESYAQAACHQPAPPSSPSPLSSSHLGNAGSEAGGAPLALRATLVIEGRLRPGDRLWIERFEPERRAGGRFVWSRLIGEFSTAWQLLREEAPAQPAGIAPAPQSQFRSTAIPLRFSVEIEGEIRDPSYLARLPRGVSVDAAGRFLLIRPLSPHHGLLPEWTLYRRNVSVA